MATGLTKKLTTAREQIKEAYINGATLQDIADLHSASVGTVRNLLKEMGVELRRRGRRQNAQAKPVVLNVTGEQSSDVQYEGGSF